MGLSRNFIGTAIGVGVAVTAVTVFALNSRGKKNGGKKEGAAGAADPSQATAADEEAIKRELEVTKGEVASKMRLSESVEELEKLIIQAEQMGGMDDEVQVGKVRLEALMERQQQLKKARSDLKKAEDVESLQAAIKEAEQFQALFNEVKGAKLRLADMKNTQEKRTAIQRDLERAASSEDLEQLEVALTKARAIGGLEEVVSSAERTSAVLAEKKARQEKARSAVMEARNADELSTAIEYAKEVGLQSLVEDAGVRLDEMKRRERLSAMPRKLQFDIIRGEVDTEGGAGGERGADGSGVHDISNSALMQSVFLSTTSESEGEKGTPSKDGQNIAPYMRLSFGSKIAQTAEKQGEKNPVWNETIVFPIDDPENAPTEVKLECFDWAQICKDDFIGSCIVKTEPIFDKSSGDVIDEKVYTLVNRNGEECGRVYMRIRKVF
eukprot:CAMPEP_0113917218 /NCGR_PEP_ID=MMETSP0780_2-20120614/32598_1 /TAXON_ID=652834 /ORGANISM="Palpitomonas bilix" /LENGTH=438 /DNA_ID=CAMNT_0000916739 /DNA_START=149 /DNA_END=1465 /DNA_ORIENTATION=+ /assembly_acc=CAM_ASM_000599